MINPTNHRIESYQPQTIDPSIDSDDTRGANTSFWQESGNTFKREPEAFKADVANFERHYHAEESAAETPAIGESSESDGTAATENEEKDTELEEGETTEEENPFRQETHPLRLESADGNNGHHQKAEPIVIQPGGELVEYIHQNQSSHSTLGEDKQQEDPSAFINEVADKLLHRLLVSDPTRDNKREVRLQFNESFLPGVEVQMEHIHGALQIRLSTTNTGELGQLESHKQALQQHLSEALGDEVVVILDHDDTVAS